MSIANPFEDLFRPSHDEEINKAPLIAFAGPTGSGKTESAMRLARGYVNALVGPSGKFCVIDTEERRALYKKGRYQPWDHLYFDPPFTPERYAQAMEAAKVKGYNAVIIDSGSHEWTGDGGIMDDAEAEISKMVERMGADKASKLTALAWSKPKSRHKRFMSRQVIRFPELLIFCLRAEPKVKFVKTIENGREKTLIVDAGFQPICEKSFMFEVLVSAVMEGLPDGKPGVPIHIKPLEKDLEPVFIKDEQVCEDTGKRLAEWARARPTQPLSEEEKARLAAIERCKGLFGKLSKEHKKEFKAVYPNPLDSEPMERVMEIEKVLQNAVDTTA